MDCIICIHMGIERITNAPAPIQFELSLRGQDPTQYARIFRAISMKNAMAAMIGLPLRMTKNERNDREHESRLAIHREQEPKHVRDVADLADGVTNGDGADNNECADERARDCDA